MKLKSFSFEGDFKPAIQMHKLMFTMFTEVINQVG